MPPTKKTSNNESKNLSKNANVKFELGDEGVIKIEMTHEKCPERLGILIGLINSGALLETILDAIIEQFDKQAAERIIQSFTITSKKDRPAISPLQYFSMLGPSEENFDE